MSERVASAFTVVVSQRDFDPVAERLLRDHGCEVLSVPLAAGKGDGDLDEDTLAEALAGAHAWIVGHARVTRTLLERLPRLRAVCRRGVGYERVDTRAVRALGKVATIATGGNDAAVADHAIGLMLAVARRHRECQARLARGDWSIPVGSDLYRKTVGIVGLGRIGRGVAARLAGFECRVLACGRPVPRGAMSAGAAEATGSEATAAMASAATDARIEFVTFDELLSRSDFVSLHAPLGDDTRLMINRLTLARMKPDAVLINTARGGLVDDAALLSALKQGRLAGAGLDVFMSESDPSLAATTEALLAWPTVVATSHAAGSTTESLARTNLIAARCALAVLEGTALDPDCVIADGRPAA